MMAKIMKKSFINLKDFLHSFYMTLIFANETLGWSLKYKTMLTIITINTKALNKS